MFNLKKIKEAMELLNTKEIEKQLNEEFESCWNQKHNVKVSIKVKEAKIGLKCNTCGKELLFSCVTL